MSTSAESYVDWHEADFGAFWTSWKTSTGTARSITKPRCVGLKSILKCARNSMRPGVTIARSPLSLIARPSRLKSHLRTRFLLDQSEQLSTPCGDSRRRQSRRHGSPMPAARNCITRLTKASNDIFLKCSIDTARPYVDGYSAARGFRADQVKRSVNRCFTQAEFAWRFES